MDYNLLINGVYWGYNPLTNHLLSSWYIQVRIKRTYISKGSIFPLRTNNESYIFRGQELNIAASFLFLCMGFFFWGKVEITTIFSQKIGFGDMKQARKEEAGHSSWSDTANVRLNSLGESCLYMVSVESYLYIIVI